MKTEEELLEEFALIEQSADFINLLPKEKEEFTKGFFNQENSVTQKPTSNPLNAMRGGAEAFGDWAYNKTEGQPEVLRNILGGISGTVGAGVGAVDGILSHPFFKAIQKPAGATRNAITNYKDGGLANVLSNLVEGFNNPEKTPIFAEQASQKMSDWFIKKTEDWPESLQTPIGMIASTVAAGGGLLADAVTDPVALSGLISKFIPRGNKFNLLSQKSAAIDKEIAAVKKGFLSTAVVKSEEATKALRQQVVNLKKQKQVLLDEMTHINYKDTLLIQKQLPEALHKLNVKFGANLDKITQQLAKKGVPITNQDVNGFLNAFANSLEAKGISGKENLLENLKKLMVEFSNKPTPTSGISMKVVKNKIQTLIADSTKGMPPTAKTYPNKLLNDSLVDMLEKKGVKGYESFISRYKSVRQTFDAAIKTFQPFKGEHFTEAGQKLLNKKALYPNASPKENKLMFKLAQRGVKVDTSVSRQIKKSLDALENTISTMPKADEISKITRQKVLSGLSEELAPLLKNKNLTQLEINRLVAKSEAWKTYKKWILGGIGLGASWGFGHFKGIGLVKKGLGELE